MMQETMECEVDISDNQKTDDTLESDDNKVLEGFMSYNMYNYLGIFIVFLVIIIGALFFVTIVGTIMSLTNETDHLDDMKYSNCNPICTIDGEIYKDMGDYKVSFNPKNRLPNYVIYQLNQGSGNCAGTFTLNDGFNTYKPQSYKGTGYDRSHLVPKVDVNDCASTYSMVNIVPQLVCFNRGIWNTIEKNIRSKYAGKKILVGLDFHDTDEIIDNDENMYDDSKFNEEVMVIPSGFYKIVFDDEDRIIHHLYIEHDKNSCHKKPDDVCDYNKLPDFVQI